MVFRVHGWVQSFRVWGLGFRIQGVGQLGALGCGGLGLNAQGLMLRVSVDH